LATYASHSGTTSATGSAFLASRTFPICQTSSEVAVSPPEARTPRVLQMGVRHSGEAS